jgi:heptaprenyl diphosphate synthase
MAFQLSDDILDIAADPEASGKTPGTDLREGVRTLPVLYALEADPDGQLAGLLDGELTDDAQLEQALEQLRRSDALERSRATAADYVARAVGHLDRFDGTPVVTALTRLAEYAVDRVG